MDVIRKQVRQAIKEILSQDTRHPLDPQPGHMSILSADNIFNQYLMWAKVNNLSKSNTKNVATFAAENNLAMDSLEVQNIRQGLLKNQ